MSISAVFVSTHKEITAGISVLIQWRINIENISGFQNQYVSLDFSLHLRGPAELALIILSFVIIYR